MMSDIVIVDYGMGNLHSVKKKLDRLSIRSLVSSDPNEIKKASKIILPGVGSFKKAMERLNELNLIEILNEEILVRKKPILGICLGMQLFARHSEEGNVKGLEWLNADVVRFKMEDTVKFKVPHIGWNEIIMLKESALMKNIPGLSKFYFVHSYHFTSASKEDILNESEYSYRFVSAVEKENIFGVQYHPEKSHDIGEILLQNFANL